MKTLHNEIFTIETLNEKSDNGIFSHKVLRTKLIADKYYKPSKHTKGKFYIEQAGAQIILWCAYADLNGRPIYAPFLGFNKHQHVA